MEQEQLILKHIGSCRFIYNYGLNKKVTAYQTDKTAKGKTKEEALANLQNATGLEYDLVEETPENENSKATLKEKLAWFFKTPAIIIAIVLFVGEACLFLLKF